MPRVMAALHKAKGREGGRTRKESKKDGEVRLRAKTETRRGAQMAEGTEKQGGSGN